MAPGDRSAPKPRNRLLAALPPEDLARLWPRLQPVELVFRQTLHAPEEPITAVYFRRPAISPGWPPWTTATAPRSASSAPRA